MNFHKQGAVMKSFVKVIFLTVLVSVSAHAQEQNHLDVNTVVQKEQVTVNAEGETVTELVPIGSVVPGDI